MPKKVSEYDQEIPQSQTADNPVAPRGKELDVGHYTLILFIGPPDKIYNDYLEEFNSSLSQIMSNSLCFLFEKSHALAERLYALSWQV